MNDRLRKVLATAFACAILAVPAFAGTEERLGTGGAQESRIPVGARSVGLAYSNLSSVRGVEALFGNPAGLAQTDTHTEVLFSHAAYIADMDVNYLAFAQQMGGFGSIGVNVKVLSVGDIFRTTEEAPDGTGDVFRPTFSSFGLSYARVLTDRATFGGTVRLISESVLQTHATSVSFDFGFQYDTGVHGIRVGAAMQNFGPGAGFSGADFDRNLLIPEDDPQSANRTLSASSSTAELPALFAGSITYPVLTGDARELRLHGTYQSNSFNVDEFRVGAELGLRKQFALRLGYKLTSNDSEIFGLTYGFGVALPLGAETKLQLDYAGQTVSEFFDDVQHVGLTFKF
ncbi:MAG: PorV/PorQ family protein [Candidatus Eisenbacteria bacterium]